MRRGKAMNRPNTLCGALGAAPGCPNSGQLQSLDIAKGVSKWAIAMCAGPDNLFMTVQKDRTDNSASADTVRYPVSPLTAQTQTQPGRLLWGGLPPEVRATLEPMVRRKRHVLASSLCHTRLHNQTGIHHRRGKVCKIRA